jgi:hypothetical protein
MTKLGHLLHAFEPLLLRVEKDLLCLLTGDGRLGLSIGISTAHLNLLQDFLSLRINHVQLKSMHELLFNEADAVHDD